jgi:hypothetical protein
MSQSFADLAQSTESRNNVPTLLADAADLLALQRKTELLRQDMETATQEAISLLQGQLFERSLAQAQAHLIKAAAHFSLYRLEAGKPQEHRRQAGLETRACLKANSGLRPHLLYFSPAFRLFFDASSRIP